MKKTLTNTNNNPAKTKQVDICQTKLKHEQLYQKCNFI